MPGLTVVSENPVYIQGNYNATAASVTDAGSAAAAVIADAVTLLSSDWNDIRSFMSPTEPGTAVRRQPPATVAAFVSGKGIAFPQPASPTTSFGSDGGVHNFLRLLENWGGRHDPLSRVARQPVPQPAGGRHVQVLHYDVYDPAPANGRSTRTSCCRLLPPGTPMFRDVNTLTFRQLLRPTQ